ncbi:MAG: hypothetical protein WKF61_05270 [Luteimonas sp.]
MLLWVLIVGTFSLLFPQNPRHAARRVFAQRRVALIVSTASSSGHWSHALQGDAFQGKRADSRE